MATTVRTDEEPSGGTDGQPDRSHRKRAAVWFAAGLAALSLIALYAPREIALSLLKDELTALGLEFNGLETLDVNLFTGTVSLGPSFVADQEVAYRIGRIDARLSLGGWLKGRFHFKEVEVADTAIEIYWGKDGVLDAGVFALEQPDPDDSRPVEDDPLTEFGIDHLTVVRSVATLRDFTGVEVAFRMERAKVENVQTWTDISQGALTIEGDINDMPLSYIGTFHTDQAGLHLDLAGGLTGITPERIARLLAPDAAENLSGTLGFDLNHDLTLSEDGSLEGRSYGSVTLDGLSLMDDRAGSVALKEARLQIDLDHSVPSAAPFVLKGEIGTELNELGLVEINGAELSLDHATATIASFRSRQIGFDSETTIGFRDRIAKRLTMVNTSIIDLMINIAGSALRALISFDQEFDVVPTVAVEGIKLSQPAGAKLGRVEMVLAGGKIESRSVEARYVQRRISVGTDLTGQFGEGRLNIDGQQPTRLAFTSIDLRSDDIQLTTDLKHQELRFQLKVTANEAASSVGPDSASIKAMIFALRDTRLAKDEEETTAAGRLDISAINPRGKTEGNGQATAGERLVMSFDLSELADSVRENRFPAGRIALENWKIQEDDATVLSFTSAQVAFGAMWPTEDGKSIVLGRPGNAEVRFPARANNAGRALAPERSPSPVAARRRDLAPAASPEPSQRGDGRMVPDEVLISEVEDEETGRRSDPVDLDIPYHDETTNMPVSGRNASDTLVDTGALDNLPHGLAFEITNLVTHPPGAGHGATIDSVRGSLSQVTTSVGKPTSISFSGSTSLSGISGNSSGLSSRVGRANLLISEAVIADNALSSLTDARGRFDDVATSVPAGADRTLSIVARRAEVTIAEYRILNDAPGIAANFFANGVQLEESGTAPQRAEIAELTMSGLDIQPSGALSIAEMRLAGLKARLTERLFEGNPEDEPSPDAEETSTPGDSPAVSIGQISVAGPSRIDYVDVFYGNPVSFAIDISSATIGPFDNKRPDLPTKFSISGFVDQRAPLNLSGFVQPNSSSANFSIQADARQIPVAIFSGYAESIVGIVLDGGEATTNVDLEAEEDRLSGQIQLSVQELVARPTTPADAVQFEEEFGITLTEALELVERGPGRIEVALPVGGTMDNVEVDWDDVIDVAIGNAVGGAITGLLPWNWFATDDRPERWEATLGFDPGSARIDEEGVEFLVRAAEFLRSNPDARVSLCGQSGAADLTAMDIGGPGRTDTSRAELSAMLDLADARRSAVLEHLRSVYDIGADRLNTCRTRLEDGTGVTPAALFSVEEDLE